MDTRLQQSKYFVRVYEFFPLHLYFKPQILLKNLLLRDRYICVSFCLIFSTSERHKPFRVRAQLRDVSTILTK